MNPFSYSAQAFTTRFQDWPPSHNCISLCELPCAWLFHCPGSTAAFPSGGNQSFVSRVLSMPRGSPHSWFLFLPRWAAGDGVLARITIWFQETEHQADELQFLVFSDASLCISFICRKWNGFICKEKQKWLEVFLNAPCQWEGVKGGHGLLTPLSPFRTPYVQGLTNPEAFPSPSSITTHSLSFRWMCWEINSLDLMWLTFIGWSRWWGLWGFLIIHI